MSVCICAGLYKMTLFDISLIQTYKFIPEILETVIICLVHMLLIMIIKFKR